MSEVPHRTSGDEVELGTLLALLHGTDDRFRTVVATYRIWRHEQRLHEAFRADSEAQKRRGVSFAAVSAVSSSGEPAPAETDAEGSDNWITCRGGNDAIVYLY